MHTRPDSDEEDDRNENHPDPLGKLAMAAGILAQQTKRKAGQEGLDWCEGGKKKVKAKTHKVDNKTKKQKPDGYAASASNTASVRFNDQQHQIEALTAQGQKTQELIQLLLAQGGVSNAGQVIPIWPTMDFALGKYPCFCSSAPDPRTGRGDGPAECRPDVEEEHFRREELHLQDDGPGGE